MLTLQVAHATHAPVAATMDAALRAAVRLPPQFSSLILGSQSPSRRALLAAALGHGDAEQVLIRTHKHAHTRSHSRSLGTSFSSRRWPHPHPHPQGRVHCAGHRREGDRGPRFRPRAASARRRHCQGRCSRRAVGLPRCFLQPARDTAEEESVSTRRRFFFSRSRLADEGRLSELGRRGAVLVCGDQVVTYNGAVREKPADADEARAYIADYGLAPCSTVGALVLHDAASGRRASGVHVAHIHFDPFPPAVVDALAADPVCRRCAGGLMVEHPACAPYLRQIDGGVDSVMGLSTRLLATLLGSLSDGAS